MPCLIYNEKMKFSVQEIIDVTGAKLLHKGILEGSFEISTDTRHLNPGDIYLPLRGENFDGHNFIDAAIRKGAIGYFTQDKHKINTDAEFVLYVKNALVAYLELANYIRNKINPKVVAITGSSGKTTVKEMLSGVLAKNFRTHKSKLNHNNEIGLCQTMFSMPLDTEVVVVEMGMRNLGEIQLLSKYCEPDIAIITNVGSAHVEKLGNLKNIVSAKCEIISHLKADGVLISNDNEKIRQKTSQNVQFQGEKHYFSVHDAKNVQISQNSTKFSFDGVDYELMIEGEHNVENALLVIDAAKILGVDTAKIQEGLREFKQIEKRWEITHTKGLTIINDSYNANPESMRAVIKTVCSVYGGGKGPVYLVLGNMAELGKDEIKYHKELGEFLNDLENKGFELLTTGDLARFISVSAKCNSYNFETVQDCAKFIVQHCPEGSTLLLKASRVMQFEKIIEEIEKI